VVSRTRITEVLHRSTFGVLRSAFSARRSPLGVLRSAFCVRRTTNVEPRTTDH
jgi:hypothetical protein